jgi:hypothetical protein
MKKHILIENIIHLKTKVEQTIYVKKRIQKLQQLLDRI